jgi:hypothetical protein
MSSLVEMAMTFEAGGSEQVLGIAISKPGIKIQSLSLALGEAQFATDQVSHALSWQNFPAQRAIEVEDVGITWAHLIDSEVIVPDKAHPFKHGPVGLSVVVPGFSVHPTLRNPGWRQFLQHPLEQSAFCGRVTSVLSV